MLYIILVVVLVIAVAVAACVYVPFPGKENILPVSIGAFFGAAFAFLFSLVTSWFREGKRAKEDEKLLLQLLVATCDEIRLNVKMLTEIEANLEVVRVPADRAWTAIGDNVLPRAVALIEDISVLSGLNQVYYELAKVDAKLDVLSSFTVRGAPAIPTEPCRGTASLIHQIVVKVARASNRVAQWIESKSRKTLKPPRISQKDLDEWWEESNSVPAIVTEAQKLGIQLSDRPRYTLDD